MRMVLIALLIALLNPSSAFSYSWCDDADNELCLRCDDGSGTDVADRSTNDSTCTYNGAWGTTSMPKAYMDSYLDFDGNNDYVDCGGAAGTDFTKDTTDFAVTFWVVDFTAGNQFERYLHRTSADTGDGWQIARDNTNGVSFALETGGTLDGANTDTGDLADDSHYALSYVWSTQVYTFYINGVLSATKDITGNGSGFGWFGTDDKMCIGARCTDSSTYAESDINEIGMFSRLMDATEVNMIMESGLAHEFGVTNWCDDANNVACFLMEDDGNESNESANSSDVLIESGGDIPQDADAKFGDYSRDFEQGDTEVLYHADGNETDISGADQEISITFWIKPEGPSGGYIYYISKWDFSGAGNRQYMFRRGNSDYTDFYISSDGSTSSAIASDNATLTNGTWYHIAGTYDDTNIYLYKDGVLKDSTAINTGIYDGTSPFAVGASYVDGGGFDQYSDGLVDDVGVFDTGLSITDINDIMDNGLYYAVAGRTRRVF